MPCVLDRNALRDVQVRCGVFGERKQRSEIGYGNAEVSECHLILFGSIIYVLLIDSTRLPCCHYVKPCTLFDFLPHDHWVLFCHVMNILGKVIPVRLLKRSNGDRTPKHSVAAGLSTVLTIVPGSMSRAPVTVNKQSDLPSHVLTLTLQDDSVMRRANNVIREGLNVLSPIAGGIPVAGTPLKASIDALLIVLNSINVSQPFLNINHA